MNARTHWPIIVPFAFALAAFHAWFLPGLLLGDDQFRFSLQQIASYFPWRNAWDPSFVFGISSVDSSPAYPLWAVAGALARLGLDFAVIERVVWFWPLFVCLVAAPYAFVYRLTRSPWAACVAASVFAVNTWTVSLVQRGHIPSLVAYAFMPFVALAWLALLRTRRPANAVAFAALLTLQVMYDLRYAYIMAIACLIVGVFAIARALARRRLAPAYEVVRSASWTTLALLAFNAYWVIPQYAAPAHLPAGYDTLADFLNGSQSQSLASALALFYPFYHYVQGTNPFAPSPVEPAFFIVFALVVVATLAVCRRWLAMSLAAAALAGIILTSGPNSPFGRFDEFAFAHIPGMSLFRDISKFTALVAFAYAALLGLGFARLGAAMRAGAGRRAARPIAVALACLGIAGYAWLLRDTFNPLRLSNFATTTLSHDDQSMEDFIDRQPGYFRTVLFPTWQPELVGTAAHPVVSADYLADSAARDGGLGDFFPEYATLLDRLGSPLMPKLLAEASVRYLVVDDDPRGVLYRPFAYDLTHAESIAYFRARPWLREVARFGGYVVFELTPPSAPSAFFARSPVNVNGSPPSLAALVGTPAWSGQPAVVIPPVPFADAAHRTFISDPASGAETVTADFSTEFSERMRAWVGAQPSKKIARPIARVQMRRVDELTTSAIPDQPSLPAHPVTIEFIDPRIVSAPYANPPTGAQWRGIVGPSANVELTNWSDSALSADITVPEAFAPDTRGRVVRVTAGAVTQSFVVPGELFGFAPRAPIVLRGVELEPGLNVVRFDISTHGSGRERAAPANAFSLIFADDLAVVAQGGDTRFVRHAPHSDAQRRASVALFSSLEISLARDPKLSLNYELPPGEARIAVYAELRRRDDGADVEFVHALPTSMTSDRVELFKDVQAALDADRNARPPALTSDDASAFDLVAVRLAIVGPPDRSDVASEIRTPLSSARIVDARIDVPNASIDRSDLALDSAAKPSSQHGAQGQPPQSLVVDGHAIPLKPWRQDSLTQKYVAETAPFHLSPGHHSLSVEPSSPLQPTSIYTDSNDLTKGAGHVRGFATLSPSEYVADVDYGGLLVWPMSFAPGWQAYRISQSGATPTGIALIDAWRFRSDRLPQSYHYAVNCAFNGWFVAPGAARVVILYVPEAASEVAALLWLLLSASVVIVALAGPRARP